MSDSALKALKNDEAIDKYSISGFFIFLHLLYFKLSTTCQTTNMVLFNPEGKIQRYSSVIDILEEFYKWRLDLYEKRKEYLVSRIEREVCILSNKKKFILAVIEDEINIRNTKKQIIVE